MWSSMSFIVLYCTFRPMIHCQFRFVKCVKSVIDFFFWKWKSNCFSTIYWKSCPPSNHLCSFVNDHLIIFGWTYFLAVYSVPLIYLSILSSILYSLVYCCCLLSLGVRLCLSSDIVLALLGHVHCSELFAFLFQPQKLLVSIKKNVTGTLRLHLNYS